MPGSLCKCCSFWKILAFPCGHISFSRAFSSCVQKSSLCKNLHFSGVLQEPFGCVYTAAIGGCLAAEGEAWLAMESWDARGGQGVLEQDSASQLGQLLGNSPQPIPRALGQGTGTTEESSSKLRAQGIGFVYTWQCFRAFKTALAFESNLHYK